MFSFIRSILEKRRLEKLQAEIWRTYYYELERASEVYADAKIDRNDPDIFCYELLKEKAEKKRVLALEAAGFPQTFPTELTIQKRIFKS